MEFAKPILAAVVTLLLIGIPEQGVKPAGTTAAADGRTQPERPRSRVELPPESPGRVVHVKAGGDLQAALDAAAPGDRITLDAGATYKGPFRLLRKTGDSWIVITSAGQLPPRGRRVTPQDASRMPRLVAEGNAVFEAMPGAHHYRLVGLHISPSDGTYVNTLVQLGDRERTAEEQPHHIVIERSYLHGDRSKGSRRGVALNSRHSAVVDSHLADFKEPGADSQAIAGWNGPGPFKIENNYLEGAGENVMFGGADPAINRLVPSDIEIVRHHYTKTLRWKIDHPSYEGTPWAVKNLFELKNARRVLIEGNLFEHNWPHAENGFAILFTPRNQEGRAPWSVVEDVTFRNNVIRSVAAGFNILGRDDIKESQQTRRIVIHNNLLSDVGGKWGGNGRLFQLLDGTAGVAITNNTAERTTGGVVFGGDHDPHTGFVFKNNVMPDNGAGFVGSGTGVGRRTIERYFPDAVIQGNVFPGGNPDQYPLGNDVSRDRQRVSRAGADMRALMEAVDEVASWPN